MPHDSQPCAATPSLTDPVAFAAAGLRYMTDEHDQALDLGMDPVGSALRMFERAVEILNDLDERSA